MCPEAQEDPRPRRMIQDQSQEPSPRAVRTSLPGGSMLGGGCWDKSTLALCLKSIVSSVPTRQTLGKWQTSPRGADHSPDIPTLHLIQPNTERTEAWDGSGTNGVVVGYLCELLLSQGWGKCCEPGEKFIWKKPTGETKYTSENTFKAESLDPKLKVTIRADSGGFVSIQTGWIKGVYLAVGLRQIQMQR